MAHPENLVLLQRFLDPDQAVELAEVLMAHGIPTEIDTNNPNVVGSFTSNTANKEVLLMVKEGDLGRARQLMESLAEEEVVEGEITGHYLDSFSVEELWEVVQRPDEWNPVDVALAKKMLKEKGEEASEEKIAEARKARIHELAQPDAASGYLIASGYLFAFLGGIIGIFIALQLLRSTKVLPNGQKVYYYPEINRRDGLIMLVIGLVMLVVWNLAFLILTDY